MRDWLSLKRLCISASVESGSGKSFGLRVLALEQSSIYMRGNWRAGSSPGTLVDTEFNHDYHRKLRVFIRSKRREPGGIAHCFVVFIHDLRRAGLAADLQSVHVGFGARAAGVLDIRQHRVPHDLKIARFNSEFVAHSAGLEMSRRDGGQRVLRVNAIDQPGPQDSSSIGYCSGHHGHLQRVDGYRALTYAKVRCVAAAPA